MTQHAEEKQERVARVPLGAYVDREQHRQLGELARREDRSVSSIVRLALAQHLKRERVS